MDKADVNNVRHIMSKEEKENMVTAIEASWEQEPVLMEDIMWTMVEEYIRLNPSESDCL